MSGHHTSGGSSNWKLWILVGVLVVVIVALAFLCIRFMLGDSAPAASAPASKNPVESRRSNAVSAASPVEHRRSRRRSHKAQGGETRQS